METFTVQMIQQDIDLGLRRQCRACPVTRALNRMTGHEWSSNTVYARDTNTNELWYQSQEVARFITNFDAGNPVAPIEFTITKV